MQKWNLVYNLLKYRFLGVNAHGIHSPFVFDLYNEVIQNDAEYYGYKTIENRREELLSDNRIVTMTDLGAGSNGGLKWKRRVKDISRVSVKNQKYARLLFRLVNHFQPKSVLELGTSLGLTTAYLAIADSKVMVHSMEGCTETIAIAKETIEKLELKNVDLINDNFDKALPEFLKKHSTPDLVFFDGNHTKDATLNYFYQCLEKISENSVFIFDDIYWSGGMTEAWQEIKSNPKVTVTLDLFQFGIVFFRKEQVKQDFILKF